MIIAREPVCLVMSAPSGAGKTSLTRAMLAADPSLRLSVSWTTRAPRDSEQDGVHYHFRPQADFDALVEQGGFLESAHVFQRSYGSPAAPVQVWLDAGHDVVFDIDWQGHRQLRAALPGRVLGLFILPPSSGALRERLTGRGDAAAAVEGRMARAEDEMSHAGAFDHVVVNDDFATTLAQAQAVLTAARCARARLPGLAATLEALRRA
jgi:guanylate kinase